METRFCNALSVLFAAWLLWGCDKCADVECRNASTCDGGTCICADWFEGTDCGDPVLQDLAGWYTVTSFCDNGLEVTDRLRVIYEDKTTLRLQDMTLSFKDYQSFVIHEQFDDAGNRYYGSGSFGLNGFELEFTMIEVEGQSTRCTLSASK